MELTFNQVEAVFTDRFAIPADKAVAFRGRLQHLQRLNFPTGVNTGRGKKASYGWMQIIQLMVALDLIDLGITPDVAARGVRRGTDRLLGAVSKVICTFETAQALAKALKKGRCPYGNTQMVVASAYALTLSQADTDPEIQIQDGKEFTAKLTDDPGTEPARAFINLGARMMAVGQLVGTTVALDPIDVATDLIKWSWSSDWLDQDTQS